MQVTLAAVGRLKRGPQLTLLEDYLGRLPWRVTVKEVVESRPLSSAELKLREAELLGAALPRGAVLIALDGRGKTLSSEGLAERLGHYRDSGRAQVAFVIGGAEGLDDSLLKRADLTLSLGAMTWPHMLVRVMLAEQLFRAWSILEGHPYHRA